MRVWNKGRKGENPGKGRSGEEGKHENFRGSRDVRGE